METLKTRTQWDGIYRSVSGVHFGESNRNFCKRRKHKIFFAVLCFAAVLTGCSKDDAISSLKDKEINLYPEQVYNIDTRGAVFSTENDFIADVDENGKVTAKHVGTTIIKGNDAELKVNVLSKTNLFPIPILDFGKSLEDIRNKAGKPYYQNEKALYYDNYARTVESCTYMFKNGLLNAVIVEIKDLYATLCVDFIKEYYNPKGHYQGVYYFIDAWKADKSTITVSASVEKGKFLVIFMPSIK